MEKFVSKLSASNKFRSEGESERRAFKDKRCKKEVLFNFFFFLDGEHKFIATRKRKNNRKDKTKERDT